MRPSRDTDGKATLMTKSTPPWLSAGSFKQKPRPKVEKKKRLPKKVRELILEAHHERICSAVKP
jgi:hypothetical protein